MNRLVADVTLENIDDWFSIGKKITNVETIQRTSQHTRDKIQSEAAKEKSFIPPYKR